MLMRTRGKSGLLAECGATGGALIKMRGAQLPRRPSRTLFSTFSARFLMVSSARKGLKVEMGEERAVRSSATTTTHRYSVPNDRIEWTSERRQLLEIREPGVRRIRPDSVSSSSTGGVTFGLPELPVPQREGLRLIDRSRGFDYTLKTHLVPAAWPRSAPDVGYPVGSGIDGLRDRGESLRVRKEMLEVKQKYLRGELPEGQDEREYWICVNRYVRNRSGEDDKWKGRKGLTLFLTHGVGFGKEVSPARFSTQSAAPDPFA